MRKKFMMLGCLFLAALGGCSTQKASSPQPATEAASTEVEKTSAETATEGEDETAEEADNLEDKIDGLCEGYWLTDSKGERVPDTEYLPLPNFEELSAGSVFNVDWSTQEGEYMSGTAFLMEVGSKPLLFTAIHFFGDAAPVKGGDLPGYVTGGTIYDILDEEFKEAGTVARAVPVPDAVGINESNSVDKDLAVFELADASGLTSLKPASTPCEPGDMIYLACYLDQEISDFYEDSLYPCVVTDKRGAAIEYILEDGFVTQGASGAPLLNSDGEVVGFHIGSNGSHRIGRSIESALEQLESSGSL